MTDPDRSTRQAGATDAVLTLPGPMPDGPGGVTLGLDIGGTVLKSALVAPDGTVRYESRCSTRAQDGPDAVLRTVLDHAAETLAKALVPVAANCSHTPKPGGCGPINPGGCGSHGGGQGS